MLKNAQTPLLHIADVSGSVLFQGDCLDIMPLIPDKSVQLILADLPYGTTQCKWDSVLTFNNLTVLKEVERFIQPSGQYQRSFECLCKCGILGLNLIYNFSGYFQSSGSCFSIYNRFFIVFKTINKGLQFQS